MASITATQVLMDTPVTIESLAGDPAVVRGAFRWMQEVENCCSRFNPRSELSRLLARPRKPVKVSFVLWQAVRFALAVAEASGGFFDPTVGAELERRGFDRDYRGGARRRSAASSQPVSYRDVQLDAAANTVTLLRPLVLDLGGVAKGMAIDLAAGDLRLTGAGFAIDAGGDLFLGGWNPRGEPWKIGIRHPRREGLLAELRVSNRAVCTSGDYERGPAHFVQPARAAVPPAISATVVAPTAMAADALSTAACLMGPAAGAEWLALQPGVEGMLVGEDLVPCATPGFDALLA